MSCVGSRREQWAEGPRHSRLKEGSDQEQAVVLEGELLSTAVLAITCQKLLACGLVCTPHLGAAQQADEDAHRVQDLTAHRQLRAAVRAMLAACQGLPC